MDDDTELRTSVEGLMRNAQDLTVRLEDDPRGRAVLRQYTKFLFSEKPRSYTDLTAFLAWYGENFLFRDITHMIAGAIKYDRITELGPGNGWLIKSLAPALTDGGDRIAIDKRTALFQQHIGVKFIGQDLEVNPVFARNASYRELIVANQFLHCVENRDTIVRINRAEWLVIEVIDVAWRKQLRAFGATPLSPIELSDLFLQSEYELLAHRRSGPVEITFWRPNGAPVAP